MSGHALPRGLPGRAMHQLRRLPRRSLAATLGLLIVLGFAALMVLAPLWPHGPQQVDGAHVLAGPMLRHPLGTDAAGRDIAGRMLHGTRYALAVPAAALVLGIAIGAPLGLLAGLLGGFADTLLRRLSLGIGFIPPLLLALALVAAMGPSLRHVVVAIGLLEAMAFARALRDEVRALHDSGFIEGTVASGIAPRRLVLVHLLPTALAAIAGEMPRRAAWALGTLAAMGFVGIGTAADSTEWGAMMREGLELLYAGQWWATIFPGLALLLLGFGLQLLAAGLADLARPPAPVLAGAMGGGRR